MERDEGIGRLIAAARNGDEASMRALYDGHASRVYMVVRRYALDDGMADDFAQETWIRVFRALPGFRGDASFGTWVHRIAVNTALSGRRRVTRRDEREASAAAPVVVSRRRDPLLGLELVRAIEQLPDRMRQVLVLHDVDGYTHEEIGDILGVAAGTSKSQLFKARAKMRDLLGPEAPRVAEMAMSA